MAPNSTMLVESGKLLEQLATFCFCHPTPIVTYPKADEQLPPSQTRSEQIGSDLNQRWRPAILNCIADIVCPYLFHPRAISLCHRPRIRPYYLSARCVDQVV